MIIEYVDPIRDIELVKSISQHIRQRYGIKYQLMFEIGINTGLRISDILQLHIWQIRGKDDIALTEQKTGKAKRIYINKRLRAVIDEYCAHHTNPGDNKLPVIYQARHPRRSVSRVYAYRVLRAAGAEFGLEHIGTHTLRKTFGYHYYKRTNDIALLMELFNHSAPGITLRYIGIIQDDIKSAMMKDLYS